MYATVIHTVAALLQHRAGHFGEMHVPIPAVALHASGASDRVAKALDSCFKNAGHQVTTLAFDLSRVHPRPRHGRLGQVYRAAREDAANLSAAAHLGLEFGAHALDARIGAWQIRLHRVLQVVVAALVAIVCAGWLTDVLLMGPAAWYGLPTATFAPMRWMTTVSGYLRLTLGGGLTVLILMAGLRLALTVSPRPVIITFRSIILLLLQPIVILGIALLAVDIVPLAAFVVTVAGASVFAAGIDSAIPLLVAFGGLLALRIGWMRGPLRRAAEGVLEAFRYLGEPDYRHQVQEALDRAIVRARERAGHDGDFVRAGQGFGSMIALDSALHSRVWRPTDRMLLVTAGSPLQRYFLSLFPRTLFPESMEDVVDLIAGRLDTFRWVNIYHPRDLAGADLGLKVFNGLDVATVRRSSIVPGRADYWLDMEARRALRDGLQRLGEVEPLRVPMKDAAHRLLDPTETAPTLSLPSRARLLLRTAATLGTLGWMGWWVATAFGLLAPSDDETSALLAQSGIAVDATVTHQRQTLQRDVGVTFVDHWEFAFADPNGTPQTVRYAYNASDAFLAIRPPRFDEHAFTQQIRAACPNGGSARWWRLNNASQGCTLNAVRMRYFPGDMTVFDLPDYPRIPFRGDPIAQWTETGVAATALSFLFLIPLAIGARLLTALWGLRATDTVTVRPPAIPARARVRAPAPQHAVTGST
jgi:hypothetical protein